MEASDISILKATNQLTVKRALIFKYFYSNIYTYIYIYIHIYVALKDVFVSMMELLNSS